MVRPRLKKNKTHKKTLPSSSRAFPSHLGRASDSVFCPFLLPGTTAKGPQPGPGRRPPLHRVHRGPGGRGRRARAQGRPHFPEEEPAAPRAGVRGPQPGPGDAAALPEIPPRAAHPPAHRVLPGPRARAAGSGWGWEPVGRARADDGARGLQPSRGTRAPLPPAPRVAARRSGPQRRPGSPPARPARAFRGAACPPSPQAQTSRASLRAASPPSARFPRLRNRLDLTFVEPGLRLAPSLAR